MKARVKATEKIVEVEKTILRGRECYIQTTGEKIGSIYMEEDLDFGFDCDYAPDYWTRLEHQAAIAAMQGILSNNELYREICKSRNLEITIMEYAHALVEKYKKEE